MSLDAVVSHLSGSKSYLSSFHINGIKNIIKKKMDLNSQYYSQDGNSCALQRFFLIFIFFKAYYLFLFEGERNGTKCT